MPVFYILPETGIADVIVFDATNSVVVEEPSTATAYPIESGALITDHVREDPRQITMSGKVTNTPVTSVPGHVGEYLDVDFEFPQWIEPLAPTPGSLFRAAGGLIGDAVGAIGDALFGATPPPKLRVFVFGEVFNRPLEVETVLQKIRSGKIMCTVITETRQFSSMQIVSITTTKTRPGDKQFDITLSEIRTVATEIVDAPKPVELRGAPGADLGAKTSKDVSSADSVSASSVLVQLGQAAGVL